MMRRPASTLRHPRSGNARLRLAFCLIAAMMVAACADRPGQGIDNNTYTNVLVSWLLQRVADTRAQDANVKSRTASAAAASTISLITPSGVGVTMMSSGTPATFAAIAFIRTDDGYAALPPGT